MAIAKTAELVKVSPHNASMSLLELQVATHDFDAFKGGRYIIINTGLPLGDDKTIKRAYSVLACDPATKRVTIGVKPIDFGSASRFMATAAEGSVFSYSGPWGKLEVPPFDFEKSMPNHAILLLASYTGMSAIIGLLNEVTASLYAIDLVWYRPDSSYFLDDQMVHELAREKRVQLTIVDCPGVDDAGQSNFFLESLGGILNKPYQYALIAGDGRVNRIARAILEDQGLSSDKIIEEIFFNKAKN